MNVKKCVNGHYFDADKYQLCPHCGASVEDMIAAETAKPVEKKQKTPFWKKPDRNQEASFRSMPDKTMGKTFGIFEEETQEPPRGTKVVHMTSNPIAGSASREKQPNPRAELNRFNNEDKQFCNSCGKQNSARAKFCKYCGATMGIQKAEEKQDVHSAESVSSPEIHSEEDNTFRYQPPKEYSKALEQPEQEAAVITSQPVADDIQDDPTEPEPKAETPSLEQAVRSAVSGSDGKTVGFFSIGSSNNQASQNSVDPVVGWLVCVKGAHFGESFPIAAGRNAVGRGVSNRIILSKDNKVSREKHAWITYEPKRREFYIQAGEGSGLSYLNGEMIMESRKLQPRDSIEIGDGLYLLIPLCGDDFSWEDYIR